MPQTPVEKPHIVLSHEMLMPLQPLLEGAYQVHRLWDYPDRLAFLDGPGRQVRAIVHAGEMVLARDLLSEMPRQAASTRPTAWSATSAAFRPVEWVTAMPCALHHGTSTPS